MNTFYQPRNFDIPTDFAKPTKSFRKHVILALGALFLFVSLYLMLLFWFGFKGYRLLQFAFRGDDSFINIFFGIIFLILCLFMVKGLFIFSKKNHQQTYLKQEDQPDLFDFVNRLADEAGAPRPNKIFLTTRVNASVSYDLSILNLLFPSKKNLEIGLGLVNVLSLGELKATLAHEFGHFAQRSMLLGRYVYTSQQIAERVVNKRDALDAGIQGLSRFDLRIAWIGWLISIIVWAIRSLIQVLFSVVVVAERALSREMEFQADKVAVSLTGSDALIHALHKLRAADEAYNASFETIDSLLNEGKAVPDLFALQSNYIVQMRRILNDPLYGVSPTRTSKTGKDRIFSNSLVNPPEMWATHPSDVDREKNAKEIYIYAEIDDNSAWVIFNEEEQLRFGKTKEIIDSTKVECTPISNEEAIERMNELTFNWSFLDRKYRGVYLHRNVFLNVESIDSVYSRTIGSDIASQFQQLYPEGIENDLEAYKEFNEEITMLKLVQNEPLTVEKRKIMYRGNEIKRSQIKEILASLEKSELEVRTKLLEHDALCRIVPYHAIVASNPMLAKSLISLATLVHYAEHSSANLQDMTHKFNNTLNVVLADGRVSDDEMSKLLKDCSELEKVLSTIFSDCESIDTSEELNKKLNGKSYKDLFEPLKLGTASQGNINEWIKHVGGWVSYAQQNLSSLRNAALEVLLIQEDAISKNILEQKSLPQIERVAPNIYGYSLMIPGNERKIVTKMSLWNRFHAGIGFIPTFSKLLISAAIVFGAMWIGDTSKNAKLYVYNGLSIPVVVTIDGKSEHVSPFNSIELSLVTDNYSMITRTAEGKLIEKIAATINDWKPTYIYNVANAGFFVRQQASYVSYIESREEVIGSPNFFNVEADFIFEKNPETIYSRDDGRNIRTAVFPVEVELLSYYEEFLTPTKDVKKMIKNHLLYDEENDINLILWTGSTLSFDQNNMLVNNRLKQFPKEVASWRHIMDHSAESDKPQFKRKIQELINQDSNNPNLYYLQIRLMEDGDAQDEAFFQKSNEYPENAWLAYSAAFNYAGKNLWQQSLEKYNVAISNSEELRKFILKDVERVYRIANSIESIPEPDVLKNDLQINVIKNMEISIPNNPLNDYEQAVHDLSEGNFARAQVSLNKLDQVNYGLMLWHFAASDDVPEELVQKALLLKIDASMTSENFPMAISVLIKNNKDYSATITAIQSIEALDDKEIVVLKNFIQLIKVGKSLKDSDLVGITDYRFKLKMKLMAKILNRTLIPKSWDNEIRFGIYIHEKPYFIN